MTQILQRFNGGQCLLLIVFILGLSGQTLTAQNGPACDTYTNKTTANGLGGSFVQGVYAVGSTVYAATQGGLSISTDGGTTFTNKKNADVFGVYAVGSTVYAAMNGGGLAISTDGGTNFTNKTTANGLGSNTVYGVYAVGSTVYAATQSGLAISTNGGTTFTNKTTANGLGNNYVAGVYAVGSTVYAAVAGGLSISTNGGSSFTNKTTANGLGSNNVKAVYAVGLTVYAATNGGGLSISTNGGTTFTNKTTTNGLGGNFVQGVYAVGSTVYAATYGGLSISTDGGSSFTNKTTANGLGSSFVNGVYATSTTVYAATNSGLSFCPPPLTLTASAKPTAVCAGSTVALSVTATGGTAPYSYTWAAPAGSTLSATSTSSVSATVTTSGVNTFTVTVAGVTDSPVSTTVNVTVNPPVVATLSPSSGTITCAQTSVTLTAGGGGTYRFSAGATQINGGNTASVNTAGVYSVTVTSVNGCSAVAQTTVTGDQGVPTASLTNDGPLSCSKTSVTLTASGGGTYAFSSGAIQQGGSSANTATVSSDGTYSVIVTGPNGCSAVAQTTVTLGSDSPLAFSSQPASASSVTVGATVTTQVAVTGSGQPSYQWFKNTTSTPVANQTSSTLLLTNVQLSDAGTYLVVVTGACNSLTSTGFSLGVNVTFSYNGTTGSDGSAQTYTVPSGVYSLSVVAYGAAGGDGVRAYPSGKGGKVEALLAVTPGQMLTITVGGTPPTIESGYNGGGSGAGFPSFASGGGGGATDIRLNGNALTNRVIVAGGGAGGAAARGGSAGSAGVGGGLTGGAGQGVAAGGGGTQSAGGAGGSGDYGNGQSGSFAIGGNGFTSSVSYSTGGGGGGYYGGGSGGNQPDSHGVGGFTGSGGGGSSYTDPTYVTNVVHTQGEQSGNGQVIIVPIRTVTPAPDPDVTLLIRAQPSIIYNTKPITIVVDVYEINSVNTTGLITLRITKDNVVSLRFDPTATSVGGRAVSNASWTFSQTASYYQLTTTSVIAGGDVLSVGLSGTLTPGATKGSLSLSATVMGGGETRFDNNSATTKIDYFPNL